MRARRLLIYAGKPHCGGAAVQQFRRPKDQLTSIGPKGLQTEAIQPMEMSEFALVQTFGRTGSETWRRESCPPPRSSQVSVIENVVANEVEAAGIEPASRGISVNASTRVVGSLVVVVRDPNRQGARTTIRERSLAPDVPGVTRSDSELTTGFWASPKKALNRDYLLLGSQCEVTLGN